MIGPKSSNFIKVDNPPGVKDLASLIEFLKSPKAVEDQLAKLQAYIDKANATVEHLGTAEEIDRLLTDAKLKSAKANEELDQADEQANKLKTEAKLQAENILMTAKQSAQLVEEEAAAKMKEATAMADDVGKARARVDNDLQDAHNLANQLMEKQRDLEAREAEIKRKEAVLSQL